MNRYLTKSRFVLASECSAKLFYSGKSEYVNNKLEDEFLESLAKGGFQVGELAKLYFPGGILIDDLDHSVALEKTKELLGQKNVIIFEGAFAYNNLFVRVDILCKNDNDIDLIEVKAKSFSEESRFRNMKTGEISAKWEKYLKDVAYQKFVISKSHPEFNVKSFLMLTDKSKKASVDGLNQKFLICEENKRYRVKIIGSTHKDSLGDEILKKINTDDEVDIIHNSKYNLEGKEVTFNDLVEKYSLSYLHDNIIYDALGSKCGSCEFRADKKQLSVGLKSGYKECWAKLASFSDENFEKPHINSLWDFRKKDDYILNKKYFQSDLDRSDLEAKKPKLSNEPGLSRVDRQELQINKSKGNDNSQYLDKSGLAKEMSAWKFPLNFIDFETTAVAIPFNKGRSPYEQVAFQFSHHVINSDGSIEHKGQWINDIVGRFPNFDFIRQLKIQLENNRGTIFRYAAHENTILNIIYNQLSESSENDKKELCSWIKTITKSTKNNLEEWQGERNMVDLREMVLKYYYHPMTNGSNSIKYVLPAVLNESSFLKNKYSKPTYGSEIKSLNYKNHQWVQFGNEGKILNPYEQLPKVFANKTFEELDDLIVDEEMGIHDGGAAMMAYAQMQFTQMQQSERASITGALLKYCELDTLSMVMIWEAWNDWCKN